MVVRAEVAPRSFLVADKQGALIRNRRHIQGPQRRDRQRDPRRSVRGKELSNNNGQNRTGDTRVVTMSGRVSRRPERLAYASN